jgi:hypothetical protein
MIWWTRRQRILHPQIAIGSGLAAELAIAGTLSKSSHINHLTIDFFALLAYVSTNLADARAHGHAEL